MRDGARPHDARERRVELVDPPGRERRRDVGGEERGGLDQHRLPHLGRPPDLQIGRDGPADRLGDRNRDEGQDQEFQAKGHARLRTAADAGETVGVCKLQVNGP